MTSKQYNIYIIEDNNFFASLLEEKIKMEGSFNTQVFTSGEAALSAENFNPDIVVLDYFLSVKDENVMNGLQITREIRRRIPNLPIIILSGQKKIDVAVELLNKGACDYIEKNDYAIENVLSSIYKITELKNAYREIHSLRKKSRKDKIRISLIFMFILLSVATAFWLYQ